ncbi:fatty acid-binding protein DegV [Fervidicella metallireducens AeB]|uniref:Fatty acid-binding protein DegV n=1 Tax=Fervidicella metallireducens AeB TaxID=1403537 RepID=A0A017RVV9_9CLOT|nr:DegV family protein [Fervidicella metallireducens]EYE88913.1 fatty acid-binding protein DegV [Fervidicella metallireducens AeB]
MKMKVVADSSCDLNESLKKELNITRVPLRLYVDDEEFIDDDNLDVSDLMAKVRKSSKVARSACPSPKDFMNAYMGDESVFVVTMTSRLSGTYNSAVMAKEIFCEEVKNKFIHIFDTKGASIKETLVSIKISELIKQNYDEMKIVEKVNEYMNEMKFYFNLGSVDTLVKNGRISKLKGMIASVLNIKPILTGDEEGEIQLVENVRSEKKAFRRMIELIGESGSKFEDKILGIAHCNAKELAEKFKDEAMKLYNFKDVIIVPTGGLSSIYTNEGGILIAF